MEKMAAKAANAVCRRSRFWRLGKDGHPRRMMARYALRVLIIYNCEPEITMLHRILWPTVFVLAILGSSKYVEGTPMYGYAFGISLDNIVVPGTLASIQAGLENLGDTPIVFPIQPGFPRAGAGWGRGDGPWSPIDTLKFGPSRSHQLFFQQFSGVTINPGDTFTFILGTFYAPTNQPLGTSSKSGVNCLIDFTDTISGNLLGFSSSIGLYDYSSFDNSAHPTYTLGATSSNSGFSFFQGLVIDRATGEIISAPPSFVSEPSSATLLACGLVAFSLVAKRAIRIDPKA